MPKENNVVRGTVIYGLLLACLCFVAIACAVEQELSIESKADKTVISANEVMTFSITIEGMMKQPPQIKMPALENFDVISTSRAFNIASGKDRKKKSTFKLMYLLVPRSEGSFTIGPAEIEYKGKFYTTDPIVVEVKPAAAEPEIPEAPEEKIPKEGGFEIVI